MKATRQRLYFWPIFLGAVTSFLLCNGPGISLFTALFYPLLVAATTYTLIWSSDKAKPWRRITFVLCFTFVTAIFAFPFFEEDGNLWSPFLVCMGGATFAALLLFVFERGWKYPRTEFWSQ